MNQPVKRNYDSQLRDAQTAETRRRVVEAATREFVVLGYAKTSVSGIAAAAGVSRETVYHLIGGKPAVLKACYDVAVVGDHAQVPVADRKEYRAVLADPDPASAARSYGRLSAQLLGRIGPVLRVLAEAAHEPELADLLAQTRAERLVGIRQLLATLSGVEQDSAQLGHAVDVIYALTSPELALLLLEQRGWSLTTYGEWVGEQLADQISSLGMETHGGCS
jgi:AcrR family transcriptional regulator